MSSTQSQTLCVCSKIWCGPLQMSRSICSSAVFSALLYSNCVPVEKRTRVFFKRATFMTNESSQKNNACIKKKTLQRSSLICTVKLEATNEATGCSLVTQMAFPGQRDKGHRHSAVFSPVYFGGFPFQSNARDFSSLLSHIFASPARHRGWTVPEQHGHSADVPRPLRAHVHRAGGRALRLLQEQPLQHHDQIQGEGTHWNTLRLD